MSELDYLINECNRLNLELAAAHVVIDAARVIAEKHSYTIATVRAKFARNETVKQYDYGDEAQLIDALAAYDSVLEDKS